MPDSGAKTRQFPCYAQDHGPSDQKDSLCDFGTFPASFEYSESSARQDASNQHRLSLVHSQLKIGSANQRHPFSPAATLLSRKFKLEKGDTNGNRNREVV